MDAPGEPSVVDLSSPPAMVRDDGPCLSCGYNLRGLATRGNCPECGAAIADSMRRRWLRYSSPEYVRTLRRGAVLVEVALAGLVVASVVIWIFPGMLGSTVLWVAMGRVSSLTWLAVGLVSAWGWWCLSAADPAEGRGVEQRARIVVRWSAAACAAAVTAALVAAWTRGLWGVGGKAAEVLGPAAAGLFVVHHLLGLPHLRAVAGRVPSRVLHRSVQTLTGMGLVVVVPSGILVLLAWANHSGWNMGVLNSLWCMALPLAALLLVWYLMYWSMVERLRIELAASGRAAARGASGQGSADDPDGIGRSRMES